MLIRVVRHEHILRQCALFCVGWTGNGGCAACFRCPRRRCKILGSGVPEYVRSHIVVRTCEMMKVVGSATCSLESSENRRFHSPTFEHDMIRYILFTLRFFIPIVARQAQTHCIVVFFSRSWVFQDATFLDVECVCFDQCVTRG